MYVPLITVDFIVQSQEYINVGHIHSSSFFFQYLSRFSSIHCHFSISSIYPVASNSMHFYILLCCEHLFDRVHYVMLLVFRSKNGIDVIGILICHSVSLHTWLKLSTMHGTILWIFWLYLIYFLYTCVQLNIWFFALNVNQYHMTFAMLTPPYLFYFFRSYSALAVMTLVYK